MSSSDAKVDPGPEWLEKTKLDQDIVVMPGERIPINIEVMKIICGCSLLDS